MEVATRKKLLVVTASLYLLAVLISVSALELKRETLKFHTRDYNYFIEQAAQLSDPFLSNRFALNIDGYNLLGLQGIEGVYNLYHAIHLEAFRYIYVLLYGIFRSTLLIYIVYSLIFFLPLLYYAALPQQPTKHFWLPVVLFALLYILFPATLNSVTSSLRPRMLFAAAWSLVVLAIYFDRPFIEKLLFFGLLLGIREEGVLLGVIAAALNFVRMRGNPARWKQTLVFLFLAAVTFGLFLAFMLWGGYRRIDRMHDPRNIFYNLILPNLPIALAVLALITLGLAFFWLKRREQFHKFLFLLVYGAAIPVSGSHTLRESLRWYSLQSEISPPTAWDVYQRVVTRPATALVFYIVILLLVLLWYYTKGGSRTILVVALASLVLVFTATTLEVVPGQVAGWIRNVAPARLVWDFKENHDPYRTNVLVDYSTYQAFYDFENTLVYNRLPLWIARPETRFYPDNKELLVGQIRERRGYAVIGRESLSDLRELAQMAGVNLYEVASNNRYVVLKLGESIAQPGEPGL